MRLALISPLAVMHVSREMLFVASLHANPALESSVRRGMNAQLLVLGMDSSKKLVRSRGCDCLAMHISAHTVIVLSLPQLSQRARSRYTIMFPHIFTFCVPNTGVPPGHLSSQLLVSAKSIFSDGTP